MTEHAARRLSQMFNAIMQHERLTIIQVMRAGGLARNTVERIRDAETQQPPRDTIQRLARACATDPATKVVDPILMERYHKGLNAAAGYGDLTVAEAESVLEVVLYYQLQDAVRAREWVRIIDRFPRLREAEVEALGTDG